MNQRSLAKACTARRPRAAATGWAAVLGLTLALCGSAPAQRTSGIERLVTADATRSLSSEDPVTRGEAALVVASADARRDEARLIELASDPAPAARRRAMLALGLLATPEAVQVLEDVLKTVEGRRSEDGVFAAYALGLVPVDQAGTSVARTLTLFRRGSWKRQRDVLLALLLAMGRQGERTELGALRLLREEDANRDEQARAALLELLLPVDGSFAPRDLERLLRRGAPGERRAVVRHLARQQAGADDPWAATLLRLAQGDRDAEVRELALLGLARRRHLPALEVAARALKSAAGGECAQAVAATLAIGGASMRGALEAHLLEERDLLRLGALLEGFRAPPSAALLDRAAAVGSDDGAPPATRVAAAELVARADAARAAPMLRDLFRRLDDRPLLCRIARALQRIEAAPTALSRLMAAPVALDQHPDRWHALLAAGHAEARRQVLATLQDRDADPASVRAALTVWRRAMVLTLPADAPASLRAALD